MSDGCLTRFWVRRYCTGAGPGPIWAGRATREVTRLEAWVTLVIATTAEASRAAPDAVYTWPGLDDKVLARLEAAAVVKALPAVLGKVTSVFIKTVLTCSDIRKTHAHSDTGGTTESVETRVATKLYCWAYCGLDQTCVLPGKQKALWQWSPPVCESVLPHCSKTQFVPYALLGLVVGSCLPCRSARVLAVIGQCLTIGEYTLSPDPCCCLIKCNDYQYKYCHCKVTVTPGVAHLLLIYGVCFANLVLHSPVEECG